MRIWPTRRYWKRLALGALALVALALIANGFMAWWTEHKLQTKIAAIRAAGDPANIADLAPKPIPADQNAAAYLEQLTPRLDEFANEHGRFYDSPLGKAYDSAKDRGDPPSAEQLDAIRKIIDKYPDIERTLTAAAIFEKYASVADYSKGHNEFLDEILNRQVLKFRTAARYIGWQMEVLTADSQSDAAVGLGIRLLRLARLYEKEPLLVNCLVSVAIRGIAIQSLYDALAVGNVSPEMHAELESELAKQDNPRQMVQVLKTERAYATSATIESGLALQESTRVNPIWLSMVSWPMKSLYLNSLDVFDEQFELADRPLYEIRDRFDADGGMRTSGHGIMGDLVGLGLGAAYQANARGLALVRGLRIFNALVEYRQMHGQEASGLSDLSLPKEATIDPFSGEPLKLKHTDDGWIIYTVMQNGIDDGGDFKNQKDHGLAPRKHRATE